MLLGALAAVVLVTGMLADGAHSVRAQQPGPFFSVAVVEHAGRHFPFEQFKADVHAGCPATGTPAAHLNTASGRPALSLDLIEVADPAPAGCGFGLVQQGVPGSAVIRLANVDSATITAWTARTGINLTTTGDAVPAATPPPAATPAGPPAPASPGGEVRLGRWPLSVLIVPALMLLGGLAAGLYVRSRQASARRVAVEETVAATEPEEGGEQRARIARGHAGLLALPVDPPAADPDPSEPPDSVEAARPDDERQ